MTAAPSAPPVTAAAPGDAAAPSGAAVWPGVECPPWAQPFVDARTGLVRRVRRRPVPAHFPAAFVLVSSWVADSTAFCPWPSDSAGAGYTFGDPAPAVAAAVGEALERYCGGLLPPGLRTATREQLVREGRRTLDLDGMALFSPEQHAAPGFPFAPLTEPRLPLEWTDGRDLVDGAPTAVPATLVWASYPHARTHLPATTPIIQAGLAAGPDRAFAETSALLEVVERDAMVMTWTGRAPLRAVQVPHRIAALAAGTAGALHTRFLAFTADAAVTVIGALVRDTTTGRLSLGMGAHGDPATAAVKALGEALQLQVLLGDYDDPEGAMMRAARRPGSPLAPWRADRAYARSYREDLRDVVDYGCHLQLHLDPAVQDRFEAELDDAVTTTVDLDDLGPPAQETVLDSLVRRGYRPVSVDVTTPDVRAAGVRVVRVVVPGMVANAAAGRPFLGGDRLRRALAAAGRGPRVLPLPH